MASDGPGRVMHELVAELFPICRSLTGAGVRKTLDIIGRHIPLQIHEVPSGTKVFDWTIPDEWNIRDAYVETVGGERIIDFKDSNLHVVGYSEPVDAVMGLAELDGHLYSLPEQPEAIPYVTSYYKRTWGFCLAHKRRKSLPDTDYHVVVDSTLEPGHLTYADCLIPGESDQEIFLSTYVCHPSMANNELSGPVVTTHIAKWLLQKPRRYSYRIVFVPETIGSITYLSKNLDELKRKVIAGFNVSCIGDDRGYSYVASRYGDTYADRVAENHLKFNHPEYKKYSFLERGSDERQYCAPGVDLPLVSLCRSKYTNYPEYHTSLDDLNLVTPSGLKGGYNYVKSCLETIEQNRKYKINCLCEPQLGKRNLYPNMIVKPKVRSHKLITNIIAYLDGTNDLIDVSGITGQPVSAVIETTARLNAAGLLDIVD